MDIFTCAGRNQIPELLLISLLSVSLIHSRWSLVVGWISPWLVAAGLKPPFKDNIRLRKP